MKYVAKIEDGFVVQVTVEPDEFDAPDGWVVIGTENLVGIGWSFDGVRFAPPEPEPDAEEAQ